MGINFQPKEVPDSSMKGIITEGGVVLGFIRESEEYAGLYNIYCDFREEMEINISE
jgi:hypothetical protein